MKNKIAIASAFLAASSFSMGEVVINDFLSFEGFVDMSYSHTDVEVDKDNESDNSFGIDQVEIDWLFDFEPVTAQIDIQYEGENGSFRSDDGSDSEGSGVFVEQAFVTYHFDGEYEGVAVTAGRYASMLGFEAFEPTGLYQYSLAYDIHSADSAAAADDGVAFSDLSVIPNYAQGVKVTYETDNTFFGISVQDEAFDFDRNSFGGDDDDISSWAVEVAGSIALEDGVTFFLGGAYEDGAGNTNADVNGDTYVVNGYVTYETGAWLFAAELTYGKSESGRFSIGSDEEEVLQGLLLANYAYSDVASVTGRFSYIDNEDSTNGAAKEEFEALKYTVAHNYAFTDNLLLVTELSYVDGEITDSVGDDSDYESFLGAVELIFSF